MTTAELLERVGRLSTTSLVDAAPTLRVLPLALRPVGAACRLVGPAVTVDAGRDLVPVLQGLHDAGPGDVLVVDAGGDDRAVAGELFASEAQRRGLAGLVVLGRTRDTRTLATLAMPVWSTGVAPHAYRAAAPPRTGVTLTLDGVRVEPGDLVVGDDDGLLVGSADELAAAVEGAEAIEAREKRLQARLLEGASLFDVLNYDEHVAALRDGRPSALSFG